MPATPKLAPLEQARFLTRRLLVTGQLTEGERLLLWQALDQLARAQAAPQAGGPPLSEPDQQLSKLASQDLEAGMEAAALVCSFGEGSKPASLEQASPRKEGQP